MKQKSEYDFECCKTCDVRSTCPFKNHRGVDPETGKKCIWYSTCHSKLIKNENAGNTNSIYNKG